MAVEPHSELALDMAAAMVSAPGDRILDIPGRVVPVDPAPVAVSVHMHSMSGDHDSIVMETMHRLRVSSSWVDVFDSTNLVAVHINGGQKYIARFRLK